MARDQQILPAERLRHEHIDALEQLAFEREQAEARAEAQTRYPDHADRPLEHIGSGVSSARERTQPMTRSNHFRDVTPEQTPPWIGQLVIYRARTRGYRLPAIVTANIDTLDRRGVVRGDVPDITRELNVHLNVNSCGAKKLYQEFDIPFSAEPEPGTWGWQ